MKTTISAQDLDWLLDQLPPSVQVLSLDCFDTLLWRKVAQPTDVFFSLQNTPLFQAQGLTASMRAGSEGAARKQRKLLTDSYEVSLTDIYRELMPQASEALVAQAVAAEVACEIAHGFIYQPVARLIERARQRGLRVIVVSDTYFSVAQLRHMLSELMGEGFQNIHRVYCSSEAGKAKTTGIWPEILRQEKRQAHQLFHLGDNRLADQEAPARLGIGAAWLENHPGDLAAVLRDRASAALQVMPELRHTQALPNLFHAQLAAHDDSGAGAAEKIGYRSLGPVLFNFARFVDRELTALKAAGRPVKLAFLLRDGFMPARACAPFLGDQLAQINVSRFTAIAATLRCKNDVVKLLAGTLSKKSMPALLRQLLLPKAEAQQLLEQARRSTSEEMAFARLVLRDDTLKRIFKRSQAFRQRLVTHVKQHTGIEAGDTLVLVDLGYAGTVQNRLSDVFKEELGVDLFGLYLISKHTAESRADRKGLIDGQDADSRLIGALTAYIGLFEMICSKAEPSTEDYTEQGEPIRAKGSPPSPQLELVNQIQAAALRFVDDARAMPERHRPGACEAREWSRQAVSDIARLMYFPNREEIDCLAAFEFEFNLGTDLMLPTASLEAGVAEYRREGYALMNRDFTGQRIGYPLEMRYMDISLSTTLLSQQRFGYGIQPSEASLRKEVVPTLIATATQHVQGSEDAFATSDGFFSLHLPMSAKFDISVLWGQRYEWLQLDSIQKVTLEKPRHSEDLALGEAVFLDGVEQVEGTMVKLSAMGMMYFPACGLQDHGKYMIRVVFRPLLVRAQPTSEQVKKCTETTSSTPPLNATTEHIQEHR